MVVVGQGHRRRGLDRPGHHQPGVLADVAAGSRPARRRRRRSRPGRRPGWSAWTASGRPPRPRCPLAGPTRRRPGPGELGVALVGEHRHAVAPAPRRRRAEVGQAAGRVGRASSTQRSRARSASASLDGLQVEPRAGGVGRRHRRRPGSRPAPHPWRRSGRRRPGTSTVSRSGSAQAQVLGGRRHELLGADARGHAPRVDADPEAAVQPVGRRLGGRPARRPTTGSPRSVPEMARARPRRRAAGRTACRPSSRPSRRAGPRPAAAGRPAGRRGRAGAEARGTGVDGPRSRHVLGEAGPAGVVEDDVDARPPRRRPPGRPPRPRGARRPGRRPGPTG